MRRPVIEVHWPDDRHGFFRVYRNGLFHGAFQDAAAAGALALTLCVADNDVAELRTVRPLRSGRVQKPVVTTVTQAIKESRDRT